MATTNRQAIPAPPATPPVYSLLVATTEIQDGERWEHGIRWTPEQYEGGGVAGVNCHGGSDELEEAPNSIENLADPFVVWAEAHCTTLGFEYYDFEARARRQLASVQSSRIAAELQKGALRTADSLANVALIDSVEVGPGGSVEVEDALGELEGAMAVAYGGSRGMVHVTPQTLVELGRKNLIYESGSRWLTYPGNVVVSDAGYSAEMGEHAPDAGIFMYGTTMIGIRVSPVVVGDLEHSTNRALNFVELYAQRLVLVQFDHSSQALADLMFKVEIELPPWHFGS